MRVIEWWGPSGRVRLVPGWWKTDKQYMKVDETMRERCGLVKENRNLLCSFFLCELQTVMGRVCAALGDEKLACDPELFFDHAFCPPLKWDGIERSRRAVSSK